MRSPAPHALRTPAAATSSSKPSRRPASSFFVEEWESIDGLHSHFHTAHFTELFGALGEVLAAPPEGWVYELASTRTLDETLAAAGIGG